MITAKKPDLYIIWIGIAIMFHCIAAPLQEAEHIYQVCVKHDQKNR